MVAVTVDIAELELDGLGVQDVDTVGCANLGIGRGSCVQIAHGDLHEAGLTALSAVLNIQCSAVLLDNQELSFRTSVGDAIISLSWVWLKSALIWQSVAILSSVGESDESVRLSVSRCN